MDIKKVKTAIKIGDFVLKKNHRNKIDIKYLSNINKDVLNDDIARIYLFVVNGIIKKIGGSSGKGGIKNTIGFYTSAMTGSPGTARFIVHLLISEALEKKSKVELYMITSPKVLATINGLFGSKKFCKSDYFSAEHKYPDWNFQENHAPYPERLAQKHNLYHQNRLKNRKSLK